MVQKEKVNINAFRTLLFSFIFIYSVYFYSFFILIFSAMFLGQTVGVQSYTDHLDKLANTGTYGSRDKIFFIIFILFFVTGIIGLVRLFKALHYILEENFCYHPYIIWFFTIRFFIIQLYYEIILRITILFTREKVYQFHKSLN